METPKYNFARVHLLFGLYLYKKLIVMLLKMSSKSLK